MATQLCLLLPFAHSHFLLPPNPYCPLFSLLLPNSYFARKGQASCLYALPVM